MNETTRAWYVCTGDPCTCPKPQPLGLAVRPDATIVQAIIGLPMRLKAHRAAHGLSQRAVAKATGMSFSTVCRIESGEDYAVSNLLALAAYLDAATGGAS